nr:RNA-directed DNA polymerase, eukaryota [Tanacetum cinerariifolium]
MMELVMHTEKNDMVFHTEKTGMLRLLVDIDVGGMTVDVVDRVTCSFDDWKLKQVDLKCVHALYELHLHDIRVVPNRHEVDQRDSCLRLSYPRLFALENNKICTVAAKMSALFISSLRRDNLNGDGCFRVKDVRMMLDDMLLPKSDVPSRWVKQIPIKNGVHDVELVPPWIRQERVSTFLPLIYDNDGSCNQRDPKGGLDVYVFVGDWTCFNLWIRIVET